MVGICRLLHISSSLGTVAYAELDLITLSHSYLYEWHVAPPEAGSPLAGMVQSNHGAKIDVFTFVSNSVFSISKTPRVVCAYFLHVNSAKRTKHYKALHGPFTTMVSLMYHDVDFYCS